MDYRMLHAKTVVELRQIARAEGVKIPAGTNKALIVEMILEAQTGRARAAQQAKVEAAQAVPAQKSAEAAPEAEKPAPPAAAEAPVETAPRRRGRPRKNPQLAPDKAVEAAAESAAPQAAATSKVIKPAASRRGRPARTETSAAEPVKPATEAAKPAVEARPVVEAAKSAVEAKPVAAAKPAVETRPVAEAVKPAMEVRPAAEAAKGAAEPVRPLAGAPVKPASEPAVKPVEAAKAPLKPAVSAGDMRPEHPAAAEALRRNAPAAPRPVQGRPQPARNDAPTAADQNAQAAQPQPNAPAAQQPSAPQTHVYHRPLSTQQRMGARTQPTPGYRVPQRAPGQSLQRPMGRFNVETSQGRPVRPQEGIQGGFRRRMPEQRVPVEPRTAEQPPRPVQPQAAAPRTSENQVEAPAQTWRRPVNTPEAQQQIDERPAMNPAVPELLQSNDCGDGAGILEIHPDGYGFLRAENYLPGNRDVYVSAAQIRRFNLRTGDYVVGKTRAQLAGDRSVGLIYINEVNGQTPDTARSRRFFDSLTPVYPDERLRMERPGQNDLSLRLIDMVAPIGKGQRGMIVSQPKAGKTTLLKKIANAITTNDPEVHLIVLLIDERPEEVTDMKRSIQGEVVYSTFDEAPENHTRVSEMVLERAQRLVELGKDVVILLDSITRLARAYNLVIPPTGRSLSGGLDPGALLRPKRFFGAARNIEHGGSLTIIATALVDTGSRMDDIIFEEFKGTGNMELHLDRSLSDRRIFPAIDLYKSGTRREELLLTREELEGAYQVRRMLSKGSPQETAEQLISLVEKTKTNEEFFQKLKGWMNVCEKDGFK